MLLNLVLGCCSLKRKRTSALCLGSPRAISVIINYPPATASVFPLPHSVLACSPRLGSHTAIMCCTFGGNMGFCSPNTYLRVAYQRATSEDAMRQ
ncbi:MAG: hypothetical protein JWR09_2263 [Mucilaginibacter sp.]|nr:hypothetical protein [Mucilaginibacter sp.]